MENVMASIAASARPKSFGALSKVWPWLVLLGLVLTVAAVAEQTGSPISCERHQGAFSKGFSLGFDIDKTDCRISSIKDSPTIQFWDVPPYVGVRW
jgi:hypothetical protein